MTLIPKKLVLSVDLFGKKCILNGKEALSSQNILSKGKEAVSSKFSSN
jgi:hypothetical protein